MSLSSATQEGQVPVAFLELMNNQGEFPLNVEGVRALPHASTVVNVDAPASEVVLKLLRPLSAHLPEGTPCKVTIGALGDHWKVMLEFKGRVGHLQYAFVMPPGMEQVGRREHKRYPFRPRENVTVYLQDTALPGLGAVGTISDLSLGGLAFRPERAFRIADGARLKLDTIMFERGKIFPVVRVDGLPKMAEPLMLRGSVAHVAEKGGALFVAIVFGFMDEIQTSALTAVLNAREKLGGEGRPPPASLGAQEPSPASDTEGTPKMESAAPAELGTELPPSHEKIPPAPVKLVRLARRTSSILLVKPGGPGCNAVVTSLKEAGYVRIEQCERLDSHLVHISSKSEILLIALELGGGLDEPLQSFQNLSEKLAAHDDQVTVIITEHYDPVLLNSSERLSTPICFTSDRNWIEVLDNELELVKG